MPCYSPNTVYRGSGFTKNGKREIVWNRRDGYVDKSFQLPCGQCIGCRLENARQKGIRCMHEASLYVNNCFVTLTYSDVNMPPHRSLVYRDFTLFMKRLRDSYGYNKIRYFGGGEYGDLTARPHYHVILFNHDFDDKIFLKNLKSGFPLYTSPRLEKLWRKGMVSIGSVTLDSAIYCAKYCTKKITGRAAIEHYGIRDLDGNFIYDSNGEILQRVPERGLFSNKPGIGKPWLDRYMVDTYKDDCVVVSGKTLRIPRYYDTKFMVDHDREFSDLQADRRRLSLQYASDNTLARLRVRETVKLASRSLYTSDLE